jgi:hypothetical protein
MGFVAIVFPWNKMDLSYKAPVISSLHS